MDATISHVLLHRRRFDVTIASVHLHCLIADLEERKASRERRVLGHTSYIEARIRGEQFGHGTESDGIARILIERERSFANHHSAGD